MQRQFIGSLCVCAALLFGVTAPATASPMTYEVLVDTTSMVGAGIFELDFQLVDGGDGPTGTTVTLSNFSFGGGSVAGFPLTFGDASGDVGSTVTLNDTDFFNEFLQPFLPGSFLRFWVTSDTTLGGDPPDLFTAAFRDPDGFDILTTGFLSEFLSLTFAPEGTPVAAFGSGPGASFSFDTPLVTPMPEPTTVFLLGSGLLGVATRRRARRG